LTRVRLHRYWRALGEKLWLLPLLGLLVGIGLALGLIAVDRAHGFRLVSQSVTGSATAAQQILSTSITALVSLTSIVLTLTLVAVQLAMGQFSPRIVGTLLHDRRSQLAVGLFLATLAHAMLTLREVDPKTGQVPGVAVVVAYVLALTCVAALVLFVHHSSRSLRVGPLIDLVGRTTSEEIERLHPLSPQLEAPPTGNEVRATRSGNIVRIYVEDIVALAAATDCLIEMVPAMGDYVTEGAPLFRIHGGSADELEGALRLLVKLGPERTHEDDPAYGIRKLVDIAERSVYSSPFQDPTTSVQALHRIHEALRRLVVREFPDGLHYDDDGGLRLVIRTLNWDGYVHLAFDEIRLAGAGSPQIARRLRAALEDLRSVAPPDRRPVLELELELLERGVRRALEDEEDVRVALTPDTEGIGSGADVVVDQRPPGALDGERARPRAGAAGA
jgi:uncharacterized membrane protein